MSAKKRTPNGRYRLNLTLSKSERDSLLQVLDSAKEAALEDPKPTANMVSFADAATRIERRLS